MYQVARRWNNAFFFFFFFRATDECEGAYLKLKLYTDYVWYKWIDGECKSGVSLNQ